MNPADKYREELEEEMALEYYAKGTSEYLHLLIEESERVKK